MPFFGKSSKKLAAPGDSSSASTSLKVEMLGGVDLWLKL